MISILKYASKTFSNGASGTSIAGVFIFFHCPYIIAVSEADITYVGINNIMRLKMGLRG